MWSLSILPFISLESMNYKNVQVFYLNRLQKLDVEQFIILLFHNIDE